MRLLSSLALVLMASAAAAHPGHIEAQHGHDHWLAVAALLIAAGVTAYALWHQRRAAPRKRNDVQRDPKG